MKYIYSVLIIAAAFTSCNQQEKTTDNTTAALPEPAKPATPEDPTTAKIRATINEIETKELQAANPIRGMFIDSVRYQLVSMKEYYQVQKTQLEASAHLSTNKEKTNKALAYLDKMITTSTTDTVLYKVQFHLNASLQNNINYNEGHTKYLRKDLTEVITIFPQ
ncbi:hypothetical protein [Ferruginibacter sp.]